MSLLSNARHYAKRTIGTKPTGLVNAILHGIRPGNDDPQTMTSSETLGRGKHVHELQNHYVKPHCMEEYIKLVSKYYPKFEELSENNLKLTGSWLTDVGDLDHSVHIWQFDGYTGYHEAMSKLRAHEAYRTYCRELGPMLRMRNNQMLQEFSFWVPPAPKPEGGIYEMRSYILRPGSLLEWESYWRKGLLCRRKLCEPVGAWFSQIGALNCVHHMWQYSDLESRKKTREAAWQIDGWAETVYATVRLSNHMDARIMRGLPFSPLK